MKEVYRMIDEVDADGSGMIEWPEFLFLMSKNVRCLRRGTERLYTLR